VTLKHASAYTYGFGFGASCTLTMIGRYSLPAWVAVSVIFTLAYGMDKRSGGDQQ